MLLEGKTAIVHGAGGAIGSAVARRYAREGARVHLTGRTPATVDAVADAIRVAGGTATTSILDVLDATMVDRHAAAVAAGGGGIDICFNATSNDDVQGTSLAEMPSADVLRPVTKAVTAHLLVATAAARHMTAHGGVILVMAGGREAIPGLGGAHVAWAALAGLCRQLAADLGPQGIRVAWLLSPGSPSDDHTPGPTPTAGGLLPHHQPSYDEVARVAAFAASDGARTMTATEINITGGTVVD